MKHPVKFVPKQCKGDDASFEGHIMVVPPSYPQRCQYMELSGFVTNEEGKMDPTVNRISMMGKLAGMLKPHLNSVELKKKADGVEIKSWEEMETDPDCDGIISELAMMLVGGFRPSKN